MRGLFHLSAGVLCALATCAGCAAPAPMPDFTPEDFAALQPILTGAPLTPAREPITPENVSALTELGQLAGFGMPKSLALAPDGRTLVVGTTKGAYIHDAEDLSFKGTLAEPFYVGQVVVSPDGRLAVLHGGELLHIYPLTLNMGVKPLPIYTATVRLLTGALAFSPGGTTLMWVDEQGKIFRWSFGDAQPVEVALDKPEVQRSPKAAAFSNGAEQVALATDDRVHLWRTRDGAYLAELPTGAANALRFSPANDLLAVASRGVQLWQLQTRTVVRELTGTAGYQLAFSPDGSRIAAVDSESVTVWRIANGSLLDRWEWHSFPGGVWQLNATPAWLPDGERMVMFDASHLLQLRLGQSAPTGISVGFTLCRRNSARTLAFSTDGNWVGAVCVLRDFPRGSAAQLYLWRTTDGALVRVVNLRENAPLVRGAAGEREADAPESAAFSADLQQVLLGFRGDIALDEGVRRVGGAVQLRRADGRVLHTLRGHAFGVSAVAISPDNQTLASGDWGGTVLLWRARDGFNTRVLRLRGEVQRLAFSPDGRLLAAAAAGESRVWRVADGTLLRTLSPGDGVAFSSDSQAALLLTTQAGSLRIQQWRLDDLAQPPVQVTAFSRHRYISNLGFWDFSLDYRLFVLGESSWIDLIVLPGGTSIVEGTPLRYGEGAVFSRDGLRLLNVDFRSQFRVLGVP